MEIPKYERTDEFGNILSNERKIAFAFNIFIEDMKEHNFYRRHEERFKKIFIHIINYNDNDDDFKALSLEPPYQLAISKLEKLQNELTTQIENETNRLEEDRKLKTKQRGEAKALYKKLKIEKQIKTLQSDLLKLEAISKESLKADGLAFANGKHTIYNFFSHHILEE